MRKDSLMILAVLVSIAGCAAPNSRVATTPNHTAALKGDLPADPLQWQVISSQINPHDRTMATLFGNSTAVSYARAHSEHDYPVGSVLALVTWNQQEDARWFGANIPATPRSVEFVTLRAGTSLGPVYSYRMFEGTPLKATHSEEDSTRQGRTAYLLAEQASVLP